MRLSVIEMKKDEGKFYNLEIFKEHEDLIVFPMHEFLDFYQEIEHRLICINNIVNETSPDLSETIRYLDPHLELLGSEINELLNFDEQTLLESFNNLSSALFKALVMSSSSVSIATYSSLLLIE